MSGFVASSQFDLLPEPIDVQNFGDQQAAQSVSLRSTKTPQEWESMKPLIKRLYIEEKKALHCVAQIISEEFHFLPTKKQLTRRLHAWGFLKYKSRAVIKTTTTQKEQGRLSSNIYGIATTARSLNHSSSVDLLPDIQSNVLGAQETIEEPTNRDQSTLLYSTFDSDSWPFNRSKVTTIGSPYLDQLFAALEIGSEADISPLDLLDTVTNFDQEVEIKYLSQPELQRLCSKSKGEAHDDTRLIVFRAPHAESEKSLEIRSSAHQPCNVNRPDAFCVLGQDVDFPTGAFAYSSPWNELPPFPDGDGVVRATRLKSTTTKLFTFDDYLEGAEAIFKLQSLFSHDHFAMKGQIEAHAKICTSMGRDAEAEVWYRKLLELEQKKFPDSIRALDLVCRLADSLSAQGKMKASERLLADAHLKIMNRFTGAHELIINCLYLMQAAQLQRNAKGAEIIGRQAVQLLLAFQGPSSIATVFALLQLSRTMLAVENYSGTERLCYDLLHIFSSAKLEDDVLLLEIIQQLGIAVSHQGRFEESSTIFEAALQRVRSIPGGVDPVLTPDLSINIAMNLFLQKRFEESEVLFQELLEQKTFLCGRGHLNTQNIIHWLANLFMETGRYQEATNYYEEYYQTVIGIPGIGHDRTRRALCNVVHSYDAQTRYEEADRLCRMHLRALEDMEEDTTSDVADVKWWMEYRSDCLARGCQCSMPQCAMRQCVL